MAAADQTDDTFKAAFTTAGLVANPIAIASLAKLQLTGCPLPPGPGGSLRLLETVSYLVVAGVVFSWTPEPGAFGSAGLNLEQAEQVDAAVAAEESASTGPSSLLSLTTAVEAVSWMVFVVGFILFVQNIVSPVAGAQCVDGAAIAGGSALDLGDVLSAGADDPLL